MAASGAANSSADTNDLGRTRHTGPAPSQLTPPTTPRRMYSESGTGGAKTPATVDEGTPLLHSPLTRDLEVGGGSKIPGK